MQKIVFHNRFLEWEDNADNYTEQLTIPKHIRELLAEKGIDIKDKDKVIARITNIKTREEYLHRMPITSNGEIYVPVEIQKMVEGAGKFRITRCSSFFVLIFAKV
ncbi:hypothetical protein MHK_001133 [Candidatus Magnetomorum sp. HK-1]|nr:hypothetical protein MHK_001133 [Candidatus Magnetomorum sp. HK-1]